MRLVQCVVALYSDMCMLLWVGGWVIAGDFLGVAWDVFGFAGLAAMHWQVAGGVVRFAGWSEFVGRYFVRRRFREFLWPVCGHLLYMHCMSSGGI